MGFAKLVQSPFRFKPWRSRHLRLIASDWKAVSARPEQAYAVHLAAAIDWLCRAQDARSNRIDRGGVSAGWGFEHGWLPSYPYTSAYTIETFLAAADLLDRPDLKTRADLIIDWELSLQRSDGAFPGHFGEVGSKPVIFNTGQIMHGLLAGHLHLGRKRCLEAAVRAGHWLVRQQEADGSWRRFEHHDVPHTYNTRGTWALLATGIVSGEKALIQGALGHLDWAARQQTETGWFDHNAFTPDRQPFTHTIAYAIRGFIECATLLGDERYFAVAERAAAGVAGAQRADGWLPGTLDRNWRSKVSYACLTGNAQMALCWMRLAQERGREAFRDNARRAIAYVKRQQRVDDPDPVVRGAIAGSAPIWGRYAMFEFPNWAAKFFADALMMEMTDAPIPAVTGPSAGICEASVHG